MGGADGPEVAQHVYTELFRGSDLDPNADSLRARRCCPRTWEKGSSPGSLGDLHTRWFLVVSWQGKGTDTCFSTQPNATPVAITTSVWRISLSVLVVYSTLSINHIIKWFDS